MIPRPTIALLVLLLPLAACGDDGGGDTEAANTTPSTSVPAAARPLLEETFDDDANGWGTQDGLLTMAGGAYVWDLTDGQSLDRAPDTLIAIEDQLDVVTVETTFAADDAESVGIDCAYADVEGVHDYYTISLSREGASIVKGSFGDIPPETLAEDPTTTLPDGEAVTLGAGCRLDGDSYLLSLSVDGETVLDVADPDPLGPGAPGLRVAAIAEEEATGPTQVRFDSFTVSVPEDGPRLEG